jgi:hypothetical protein
VHSEAPVTAADLTHMPGGMRHLAVGWVRYAPETPQLVCIFDSWRAHADKNRETKHILAGRLAIRGWLWAAQCLAGWIGYCHAVTSAGVAAKAYVGSASYQSTTATVAFQVSA